MTSWTPDLESHPGPRYLAIASALAADVASGRLKPGDRLPPHRQLAWRLGVTVGTVTRAYAEAGRRGLTAGEVGRGTYIQGPAADAGFMLRRDVAPLPDLIELGFAFPAPGREAEVVPAVLKDFAADPATLDLLDYQPHSGIARHRAAGADWIARRGLVVPAEQICVTAGAQHAIAVALAAVTRPGDRVLAESPCYPGIQGVARMLGLKLEGLPLDEAGLVPEAFEAACRGDAVKALYCLPTLQNPTNVTMPEDRRRRIAAIAVRHDVALLEDDVYGLLAASAPPPLFHFAPRQTFYLTSLSKTVAPGLRVGYIAGPASAADRLAGAIRASSWMASPITAELAARLIDSGAADQIMQSRRREAEARRRLASNVLARWNAAAPAGAIHLWLTLPEPWRASQFADEAGRHGVNVTPADAFIIGRQGVTHAVRLCLGPPRDRQVLRLGLERLADLLAAGPSDALGAVV